MLRNIEKSITTNLIDGSDGGKFSAILFDETEVQMEEN